MKNNDDETAFPVAIGQTAADMKGMSLRDWFAGQAMTAMLSLEDVHLNYGESEVAVMSYQQADAMMDVREKR
jgi:hypothetical protein